MSGMEWRYWPASILPVVCVLIATMQQLQTCSAQVVHIEDVVNATIRLGCYNNTAKDDLAVGTASQFHWSSNRLPSNQDLQSGSSPFYSYKVKEQDDGLQITCVIDITSSLFNERLKDHPELISVRPPTYRVAVLVPLFYNPSLAPNPTPEPCSLVTCPYSGSGVTTTFTMNTTGPFDCGGNCFSCNSSCKHIGVTPAEENMCFSARDVDCFTPVAGESNKVIIKRDCYGCLRCDASNTVKGITRREKFSFNLNRPTASACGPCNAAYDGGAYRPDSNTPLVVSPSANATLGIDTLTISFLFQSKYAVDVRVYNGSDGRRLYFINPTDYMDFRTSLELLSFEDCRFKYTLTMRRPQVWVSHIWAFLFRWQSDTDTVTPAPIRQLWQNVSISLTERKCDNNEKNCPNGQCVLDWSNHPSCVCPYQVYGTTCQLTCPNSNGATTPLVDAEIIIPVGCHTIVVLVCPLAVSNTGLLYSWRQNGQLQLKGPSTFTVLSDSIGRDWAGNYSCYFSSNNTYLGSVLVYIADNPVLASGLNNGPVYVRNEAQAAGVINLSLNTTETYNASSVQYRWTAIGGSLCGGKQGECAVQRNSSLLKVLPCCTGLYRGCARNDFGETCEDFQVIVEDGRCPNPPRFTGSGVDVSGNGYVTFSGDNNTDVLWTSSNDDNIFTKAVQLFLPNTSNSCCCLQATLSGTDAPEGLYQACVQIPGALDDTITICYAHLVNHKGIAGRKDNTKWLLIIISISGCISGLSFTFSFTMVYRRWRTDRTKLYSLQTTAGEDFSMDGLDYRIPSDVDVAKPQVTQLHKVVKVADEKLYLFTAIEWDSNVHLSEPMMVSLKEPAVLEGLKLFIVHIEDEEPIPSSVARDGDLQPSHESVAQPFTFAGNDGKLYRSSGIPGVSRRQWRRTYPARCGFRVVFDSTHQKITYYQTHFRMQYIAAMQHDVSLSKFEETMRHFLTEYRYCRIQTYTTTFRVPDGIRLEVRPVLSKKPSAKLGHVADGNGCEEYHATSRECVIVRPGHNLLLYKICIYEEDMWTPRRDESFIPRLDTQPKKIQTSAYQAYVLCTDVSPHLHMGGTVQCTRYCVTRAAGESCGRCPVEDSLMCDFKRDWMADGNSTIIQGNTLSLAANQAPPSVLNQHRVRPVGGPISPVSPVSAFETSSQKIDADTHV
eukprot:scpid21626/ scgid0383/ 